MLRGLLTNIRPTLFLEIILQRRPFVQMLIIFLRLAHLLVATTQHLNTKDVTTFPLLILLTNNICVKAVVTMGTFLNRVLMHHLGLAVTEEGIGRDL